MANTIDTQSAQQGRGLVATDQVPVVRITDVVKRFRRGDGSIANAIDGVSFDVMPGEFVVLLGPSGCGKTTLLRTLAGLEQADSGEIEIRGTTVYSAKKGIEFAPERRRLSMIFQSYALWPHMTGFDNVAYPLRSRKTDRLSKDQIRERVDRVFAMVGVSELRGQYPGQMSGGQQQRVALARALVGDDDLVLFDEPLSNVDAKVRETLRRELLEMQRELGFAAVYVTHDQNEAMELAHRVAVMGNGKVQQLGQPHEIYLRPTSRYVSKFVGTSNEIAGTVASIDNGAVVVTTEAGELHGVAGNDSLEVGMQVVASFRPEQGVVTAIDPGPGVNRWPAVVDRLLFLGAQTEQIVRLGGLELRLVTLGMVDRHSGESAWVAVAPEHVRVLPAN